MKLSEGFFMVRTTVQPLNWALDQDPEILLRKVWPDTFFQEALYLGSPTLFAETEKWINTPCADKTKAHKLVLSCYKYILRMSSRPTPYGLFAGWAMGYPAERSELKVGDIRKNQVERSVDFTLLEAVVDKLLTVPEIRRQLRYHTNDSLYRVNREFRYVYGSVRGSRKYYELKSVDHSRFLEEIIIQGKQDVLFDSIEKFLIQEGIEKEEATGFCDELIDAQLLVPELIPSSFEKDPLLYLLTSLRKIAGAESIIAPLEVIHYELKRPGFGVDRYQQIQSSLSQILEKGLYSNPVHVTLQVCMEHDEVSKKAMQEVVSMMAELQQLGYNHQDTGLTSFKNEFSERWENQEVPLNIALDNEYGIGYGNHRGMAADPHQFLEDLPTLELRTTSDPDRLFPLKFAKLKESLINQSVSVEITKEEIRRYQQKTLRPLPSSLYILGRWHAKNGEALDNGDYFFELNSFNGPSTDKLMSRFAVQSEHLAQLLKDCINKEEAAAPDCLWAEVVHVPNSKVGNISARPPLRSVELVYLTQSSKKAVRLTTDDIMVSVKNGEIVLRSKSLNKRIIPRMGTAHNFHVDSLPLYRFLCNLQYQGCAIPFNWDWDLFETETFLPRITYKKLVLRKSQWIIRLSEYSEIRDLKGNELVRWMERFRTVKNIPNLVFLTMFDNELLLNLNHLACCEILQKELIRNKVIGVTECLQNINEGVVTGSGGYYSQEVILPVESPALQLNGSISSADDTSVKRSWPPGSNCIYYKIYTGVSFSNTLLRTVISPLLENFHQKKILSRWFFVRYTDPQPHLRLRIWVSDPKHLATVMQHLAVAMEPLSLEKAIHKVQIDTYVRELERYGPSAIEVCEEIFELDSAYVLQVLPLLEHLPASAFWLTAMTGIDDFLTSAGYDRKKKLAFVQERQNDFFAEFGIGAAGKRIINNKYRIYRKHITSSFSDTTGPNAVEKKLRELSVAKIQALEGKMMRARPLWVVDHKGESDVLADLIHMFVNRWFTSKQRKYEMVLYCLLFRYYTEVTNRLQPS